MNHSPLVARRPALVVPAAGTPALTTVGTRLGRPLMTWHPAWVPVLEAFAAADPPQPRWESLEWYRNESFGAPPDETVDLDALPADVAAAVRAMGASLWQVRVVPDGGLAHLTGMTQPVGRHISALLAALKGAVVEASAHHTTGMKAPIGMGSGSEDGSFPLHADIFPGRYLLNVFHQPAPDQQGASLLMSVAEWGELAAVAFGPEWAARSLRLVRREVPWDMEAYEEVFGYHDRPDDSGLIAASDAAATRILYGPGEGYLVDDAEWLHGRTVVRKSEHTYDRVHRLTFDTAGSFAQRMALEDRPENTA
ncbi:hypothetical protein [Geodermatophilus ruber]|uniref:Taurine catabolism dioxygenase TauD, TfdA family n=1 Tax=Geodermatophilus ruber TaxID=504800 RepID=A0A1I4EKC4_9ACTN|nr:hypothetical protein [Geodermatophilus ruber]SFL06165.1 hypothetical protein SAMN04488085_10670 [Geodermatophilus ruber]